MFGLFKTSRCADPELGALRYSRRLWRGMLVVDGSPAPLALGGSRSGPSAEALALARSACAHLASCRAVIEAELHSHYLGYVEAVAAGDFEPEEPLPPLQAARSVWAHVRAEFVAIVPLGGQLTTEFGFAAAWDQEHTLGVRLQRGAFVELCGSTVAP